MILIPQGRGRIKRFRLPRFLIPFIFLFLISWATCLFLLFWDYHAARIRISELVWLEREERRSQIRLRNLERQINRFARKIDEYEEFALNVENLLDLKTDLSSPHLPGMGGSEEDLLMLNGAKDVEFKYQAQFMHLSLDEMNERINDIEQGQTACSSFIVNRKLVLVRVRPPLPGKEGKIGITPEADGLVIQTLSLSSQSLQPLPSFP